MENNHICVEMLIPWTRNSKQSLFQRSSSWALNPNKQTKIDGDFLKDFLVSIKS